MSLNFIDLNNTIIAYYADPEEARKAFALLHATLPAFGRNAYGLHIEDRLETCSEMEWDAEFPYEDDLDY